MTTAITTLDGWPIMTVVGPDKATETVLYEQRWFWGATAGKWESRGPVGDLDEVANRIAIIVNATFIKRKT